MMTHIYKYCKVMLLLCICLPSLSGQEYYNIPLSSAKYFDNNTCFGTTIDSADNLWIGTNSGLYRFDGGQSINAKYLINGWDELSEAFITHIQCDQENNLWINTTTQGIAVIDISTMECKRIELTNNQGARVKDYNLQDLTLDNKNAYASLWNSNEIDGGILKINLKTQQTTITPLKNIIVPGSMHNDKENPDILWITGESLIKFNKTTEQYNEIEYDSTINANHLITIDENQKGDLFIVLGNRFGDNRRNNILRYNKKSKIWSIDEGLSDLDYTINYTSMYNDSLLLFTTSDDIQYQMYDTYNKKIVKWDLQNEMLRSEGEIINLSNGDIALSGFNINYLKRTKKAYSSIEIEPNPTNQDNFYGVGHYIENSYVFPKLGSTNQYYSLDTSTLITIEKPLNTKYNYRAFHKIAPLKSLAVARDAIATIDHSTGAVSTLMTIDDYLPKEESSKMFYNSTADVNGNVWISTSHNTVLKYDQNTENLINYYLPSKKEENSIFVFDITADSLGNIFAAGRYQVLYKGNSDANFTALSDRFPNLELPSNIIPYSINSTGPNEILLGTWAKGIYKINTLQNQVKKVGPEINNTYIESIRPLQGNRFIFFSQNYIALYDSQNDNYKLLDTKDGIDNIPLRNPATLHLQGLDAISWNSELRMFSVDSLLTGKDKNISISRIAVNGKIKSIHNQLTLNHDENNININYALSEYDIYNQIRYRYQLLPHDQEWIDVDNRKELMFTNLEPNQYTLNLQSTNINGFWINNTTSIIIDINPPWYATVWFKLLMIFAAIALLWSLIRFYINYQKRNLEYEKRFAQLETMILKSQMNPHFIFNSLNSIRYLFMKDQKDKGLKYITKFAKLLRSTLHHGEHSLVKLSEEIELTELFIDLEQLRFEDKFEYLAKFGKNKNWENIKIPPFVIQPLVENAFWHGLSQSTNTEKKLKIKIEKSGRSWMIHVEDNGVGIGNSKSSNDMSVGKKKSYGLSLIKERFELINKTQSNQYSISIHPSSKDSGTNIIISITPNS